jgi:hypothetical protein
MAVEVPAGYQCISACTIAFMGGMLRYIDDQGKFRVHSASGFEGGVNKRMAAQLQANPDSALIKIAQIEQISQRYLALRLYTLFYDTLDLPKNPNPPAENDAEFCKWAGGVYESDTFQDGRTDSGCDAEGQSLVSPHFVYTDPKNTERAADVARIRHEGPAAYQDILMRIERECMAMALKDIESTIHQPDKRTEGAREMLRAMYMTSIMDTSYMTPLQLVTMGYVNKNFGP